MERTAYTRTMNQLNRCQAAYDSMTPAYDGDMTEREYDELVEQMGREGREMKRFEVTIPFRCGPWYTGYAMADDKLTAIRLVAAAAKAQGWTGCPSGKAEVLEIKEGI